MSKEQQQPVKIRSIEVLWDDENNVITGLMFENDDKINMLSKGYCNQIINLLEAANLGLEP
jgi:hypothetical protein